MTLAADGMHLAGSAASEPAATHREVLAMPPLPPVTSATRPDSSGSIMVMIEKIRLAALRFDYGSRC